MNKVIALLILSPIFFYVIFQPSIDRTISYRDQVLQKQAYELAHLTSLEGRLTPAIRAQILNKLASIYFDTSKVTITGPDSTVERGELFTVTLRYPQGRTEIFDLFGSAPSRDYYYPIPIMSEYIVSEDQL
ncbi:MAG TPA: hypothetical protein IAA29_21265 [Candidatus Paenibacillus intestinavium]|nr:hypothetical protein [Candidatus Paenibacillus intestinavium]